MKNKIYNILKILVILTIVLVTLTACGEKEEETSKKSKKVNKVTKSDANVSELVLKEIENGTFSMIDNDPIESFCNEEESKLISDEKNGVLSIVVQDFDNDGQEEAIVVNIDNNNISLELYTPDGETLVKTDSYKLPELLKNSDSIDFSIFAKKEDNKINLYYESIGSTSIFADGTDWNFGKLSIENAEFKELAHEKYAGSMMDEETEEKLLKSVNKTGLDVKEIGFIGRNIVFQLDNVIELCAITRTHTDEYNSFIEAIQSGAKPKSSRIRYGHTIYLNLINNDECKLNLEVPDVTEKVEKATYNMALEYEKATLTFGDNDSIMYSLIEIETGTYEVLGNRVLAIYTNVQDPTTEDYVRINHEKHYRILEDKLIDGTDIYIKEN